MNNKDKAKISLLFFGALAANVYCIPFWGTGDMRAWVRTISVTLENGPKAAYGIYNMYYPPLASLMLWLVGKISLQNFQGINHAGDYTDFAIIGSRILTVKLSIFFFFYLTAGLFFLYLIKVKKYEFWLALRVASLILANVAFIEITTVLGYIDIFFAPFLILSLYSLERRSYLWTGIWFAVTFSIKLIPVFLLPVFICYFLDVSLKPLKVKLRLKPLLLLGLGIIIVLLPQVLFYDVRQIVSIIRLSSERGSNLSLNATNFHWILRTLHYSNNITTPRVFHLSRDIFYGISTLLLFWLMVSRKTIDNFLYVSVGILVNYFVFFTGVHENHLFPALLLSTCLFVYNPSKKNRTIYTMISAIVFLNLFIFYRFSIGDHPVGDKILTLLNSGHPSVFVVVTIALSLFTTCYLLIYLIPFLFRISKEFSADQVLKINEG